MLERLCRVKASQAFKSRRHPTTNGISSALFSPKHCSSFQRWQRQQLCVSRLVDYKALELVLRWTLVSVHDPCVLCGASIMMLANATQLQSCLKGSRPSAYSSLSVSNLRVIRSTRASGSRTVRAASADEQNEVGVATMPSQRKYLWRLFCGRRLQTDVMSFCQRTQALGSIHAPPIRAATFKKRGPPVWSMGLCTARAQIGM